MNPHLRAALMAVSGTFLGSLAPHSALASYHSAALSGENIAASALSVAESMRTTGRCYAGVSRALSPFGVSLHGMAAYEAKDQLIHDPRFTPVSIREINELHRGDIIVYCRSASHPYGHISVYEGADEEASDHLSHVTPTSAYGGATVFRLRSEAIVMAPALEAYPANGYPANGYPPNAYRPDVSPPATALDDMNENPSGFRPSHSTIGAGKMRSAANLLRREYRILAGETIETSLTRRVARFLIQK